MSHEKGLLFEDAYNVRLQVKENFSATLNWNIANTLIQQDRSQAIPYNVVSVFSPLRKFYRSNPDSEDYLYSAEVI